MKLNWNFPGGRGVQNKKPSVGGVWIFPGTTHSYFSLKDNVQGIGSIEFKFLKFC